MVGVDQRARQLARAVALDAHFVRMLVDEVAHRVDVALGQDLPFVDEQDLRGDGLDLEQHVRRDDHAAPVSPSALTTSSTLTRASGSQPVSGSSRKMTSGSCAIACASLTRWRMPFEYSAMRRVMRVGEVEPGQHVLGALLGVAGGRCRAAGYRGDELEPGQVFVAALVLGAVADAAHERAVVPDWLAEDLHLAL